MSELAVQAAARVAASLGLLGCKMQSAAAVVLWLGARARAWDFASLCHSPCMMSFHSGVAVNIQGHVGKHRDLLVQGVGVTKPKPIALVTASLNARVRAATRSTVLAWRGRLFPTQTVTRVLF